MGYLRFALKYRLPIVPVGAAGVDDAYIGLNDGTALAHRLGLPRGLAVWFGLGPLGVFPFSPPFPVKMHQIIGAPIELPRGVDLKNPQVLLPLHELVTRKVQHLLDVACRRVREGRV